MPYFMLCKTVLKVITNFNGAELTLNYHWCLRLLMFVSNCTQTQAHTLCTCMKQLWLVLIFMTIKIVLLECSQNATPGYEASLYSAILHFIAAFFVTAGFRNDY